MHTMRYWNNRHQAHGQKIGKPNNVEVFQTTAPKCLKTVKSIKSRTFIQE